MLFSYIDNPRGSVFYEASVVLDIVNKNRALKIGELYIKVSERIDIGFSSLILCLDWLYMIKAVELNSEGYIKSCI